jgi:hypothetical protein
MRAPRAQPCNRASVVRYYTDLVSKGIRYFIPARQTWCRRDDVTSLMVDATKPSDLELISVDKGKLEERLVPKVT